VTSYYAKSALEILQEEGPIALSYKSARFISRVFPRTGVPYYDQIRSYYNWKRSGVYDHRPDPFKIVRVDPTTIEHNSKNRFSYLNGKYRDSGKVVGGNWDISDEKQGKITIYDSNEQKNTIYNSFCLHFEQGYGWENTPFIQKVIRRINDGEDSVWHGCSTRSEVLNRCVKMDRMFQDISENGYISQKELIKQRTPGLKNPHQFKRAYDEVVVNIARDGELLFVGGHHRLAMAKILGINKIPIRVFVRHKQWQELLDEIHKNGLPEGREDLRDHPDLQDILN